MRRKGVFVRTETGFAPWDRDPRAAEIMRKVEVGKRVMLEVRTARNPEFSALVHVVFGKIGDAVGLPMENIKLWIKLETGRVDLIKFPDGSIHPSPQSVAFDAMTEEEFRDFWNDALPVITEKILPKMDRQSFDEIVSIINGRANQ